MKTFVLIICGFLIGSLIVACLSADNNKRPVTISPAKTIIADSIAPCDSLKRILDSVQAKYFVAAYKVERVKYYLAITIKNPTQTKFLKGWIKRAVQ